MASAADGGSRGEVRAPGELFSVGAGLEAGARAAAPTSADELAEVAGRNRGRTEPGESLDVSEFSGELLLDPGEAGAGGWGNSQVVSRRSGERFEVAGR